MRNDLDPIFVNRAKKYRKKTKKDRMKYILHRIQYHNSTGVAKPIRKGPDESV